MPLKINPSTACFDLVSSTGSSPPSTSFPIDSNTAPGTNPVVPDGSGVLTILGAAVASHSTPIETHSRAANAFNIEVQVSSAIGAAPADKTDAGICSFDSTNFTVDANGFVQIVLGSSAIGTMQGDDSVPVAPDGSGLFTLLGNTVANATHAKPVYVKDSATANALDIDVQVATAIAAAPGDTNDAGLCSFDSSQFTVDADGFVQLIGGSAAVDSFTTDLGGPVTPDGTGNINLINGQVFTDGTAANSIVMSVEATQYTFLYGEGNNVAMSELGPLTNGQLPIGSTGAAPVAANLTAGAGIVITNGAGSITIEADTGGLGWVEETTTSRALVEDQGVVGNNGATITMTLPATAAQFSIFRFLRKGAGVIKIAQNAGQTIHTSTADSTTGAGGYIQSTAQWNAIELICTTANTDFAVLSSQGNWNVV